MAGIPPLAGLCAKFAMFLAILRPANPWATALAVIAAIIRPCWGRRGAPSTRSEALPGSGDRVAGYRGR